MHEVSCGLCDSWASGFRYCC